MALVVLVPDLSAALKRPVEMGNLMGDGENVDIGIGCS